ncbi:MAG: hypothetical protein HC871_03360 [Rhizobiales bacterium]|nr:hypothetical protein [Hyphomicrobiales bacterium]
MKKQQGRFDAAVWKGQIDVTTVSVRLGMMAGLGLLWLGLVGWMFFSA